MFPDSSNCWLHCFPGWLCSGTSSCLEALTGYHCPSCHSHSSCGNAPGRGSPSVHLIAWASSLHLALNTASLPTFSSAPAQMLGAGISCDGFPCSVCAAHTPVGQVSREAHWHPWHGRSQPPPQPWEAEVGPCSEPRFPAVAPHSHPCPFDFISPEAPGDYPAAWCGQKRRSPQLCSPTTFALSFMCC